MFSSTSQNEIWVQLLEKAWAKAIGSYAQAIGGNTEESLRALTGAPVKTFYHSDVEPDKFLNLLDKFDEMNYVMCTIVGNKHSGKTGLEKLHSYSLISVHSYHKQQLLKI